MQLDTEELRRALRPQRSSMDEPDFADKLGARNQVYLRLRQAIICGNLSPGTVLTLRAISEVLGVSVMPVREAMHVLIKEGAVEQPNNKTFSIVKLTMEEFDELKAIRLVLEGRAIRKAAVQISDATIDRLTFYQSNIESLSKTDRKEYLVENYRFHFMIYRSANLPKLVSFIEMAWLQYAPNLSYYISQEARSKGNVVHRDMIAALSARDPEAAFNALKRDIDTASEIMREHTIPTHKSA